MEKKKLCCTKQNFRNVIGFFSESTKIVLSRFITEFLENADYGNHNNLLAQHVCEGADINIHLPRSHVSKLLRLPTHLFPYVL